MNPSDSVLRCLVAVKHQGEVSEQIIDAVQDGENYLLVLEWGTQDESPAGVSPRQYVVVPATEIELVKDQRQNHEIISRIGIDFDDATISDTKMVVKRLFQPPPD